jgi:hypothetical protein
MKFLMDKRFKTEDNFDKNLQGIEDFLTHSMNRSIVRVTLKKVVGNQVFFHGPDLTKIILKFLDSEVNELDLENFINIVETVKKREIRGILKLRGGLLIIGKKNIDAGVFVTDICTKGPSITELEGLNCHQCGYDITKKKLYTTTAFRDFLNTREVKIIHNFELAKSLDDINNYDERIYFNNDVELGLLKVFASYKQNPLAFKDSNLKKLEKNEPLIKELMGILPQEEYGFIMRSFLEQNKKIVSKLKTLKAYPGLLAASFRRCDGSSSKLKEFLKKFPEKRYLKYGEEMLSYSTRIEGDINKYTSIIHYCESVGFLYPLFKKDIKLVDKIIREIPIEDCIHKDTVLNAIRKVRENINDSIEPLGIEFSYDNFEITELHTKIDLQLESSEMSHCIQSYWGKVKRRGAKVYSIKSKGARSTLEIILQEKKIVIGGHFAKCNEKPGKSHKKIALDILNDIRDYYKDEENSR